MVEVKLNFKIELFSFEIKEKNGVMVESSEFCNSFT